MELEPGVAQRRLRSMAVGLTALFTGLGFVWGRDFGLAVAAGGLLALANYGIIIWTVGGLVSRRPRRASCLAVVGFGLRYMLLGLALYVIFAFWHANVVAVSLGLSAPVAAVFIELGLATYGQFASRNGSPTVAGQHQGDQTPAGPPRKP